jgi:predicted anti-sigma-YlaC factor YlaD
MVKLTSEESKLGFFAKINYKMHLMMCEKCRSFVANMNTLNSSLKSLIKSKTQIDETKIKSLEEEIKKKIHDECG